MNSHLTLILLLIGVMCTPMAEALGPRPYNEDPKAEIAYADTVFTAQVLATVPVFTDLTFENNHIGFQYLVHVQSIWKGELPETVWLHYSLLEEGDHNNFKNGDAYLIYASRLNEELHSDRYYRNQKLSVEEIAGELEILGAPIMEFPLDDRSAEDQMLQIFENWIDAGHDANEEFGNAGVTPLQIAALNNEYECAGALMNFGAHTWIDTPALPISPLVIVNSWYDDQWVDKLALFDFYEGDTSNRNVLQGMFATYSREKALLVFIIVVFTALLIRMRYTMKNPIA